MLGNMADFLGSILDQLEKPPSIGSEERKKAKAEKLKIEKIQQREKENLKQFRNKVQKVINDFIKDSEAQKYRFDPMDKVYRAVLHEVAEIAGLTSFSFGQDEVDRYVMVWKKEFAPGDDELAAYRNGETWDPEAAKALAEQKKLLTEAESDKPKKITPHNDYHEKYAKLLGTTSAKDAAQITTANRSYGFVSSENKRDRRTIEQVMADTRAKKKLKTEGSNQESSASTSTISGRTDHDKKEQNSN